MKTNPFDYNKAIDQKTEMESIMDFVPYLTIHSYSNHLDTCLLANELNTRPNLPPLAQYDFLYETVRKGRRFGKWFKPEENPHLELVMNHFQFSKSKALEALQVLTQSELKAIKELHDK